MMSRELTLGRKPKSRRPSDTSFAAIESPRKKFRRSALRLDLCEDRTLASANPVASLWQQSVISSSASVTTTDNGPRTTDASRHELVIIDPRVPDSQTLIHDLQASIAAGRH